MRNKRITVVGAGSWGTALSILLSRNGYDVDLWVYEQDLCQQIREKRKNRLYLPGYSLPESIQPTNSLKEAIGRNEVVLLVVPTHIVRKTATEMVPLVNPNSLIINAGKGIENDSLSTIRKILKDTLPDHCHLATLSGPTFAIEVAQGVPSAIVAAAETDDLAEKIQSIFSCPLLKVFTSTDPVGVEIGGALKNIIAIATGISDGLGMGHNARAALITRGLVEITRIGTALGARPETFSGLSGLGDLVLTCTGELSRNRQVGLKIGQGEKLTDITRNMKMVAEGILTVKSAYALKSKLNIQASVIDETYKVLYESKSPQQAVEDLMRVNITSEFAGVKGL
ncbi:MAG: NAD(P)H-dependent glycerol-3-phosphate dehydrogenase [Nitrospinaceae bacterium]|jgi:glycerol-3-phosphate dehydrogenase (NAD(P)+)|nr:NAD(P)H-dependent glycerol-3-phosphate dehydrogenase [Nitrospinaceae bacterium]MDP7058500.1 NAD(P)H-dependent glycerol-3-phosphate dehydrogenase [Nitrospinaceae bacterium]HAK36739.1 glycerol-3-phosphate dehydrogenase [Nitrospina sp.]